MRLALFALMTVATALPARAVTSRIRFDGGSASAAATFGDHRCNTTRAAGGRACGACSGASRSATPEIPGARAPTQTGTQLTGRDEKP